ncbi:MAG: hypothetical protein HQM03_08065, partial [Magnetococcales bacterium]|nr:hypothetical protein [Magnetococcales bacterium]
TTTATRDITIAAVNDATGITTTAIPLDYQESAVTAVDDNLSLADVDDDTIVGATVQITSNFLASEDLLLFHDQSGITGTWNAATGTLTLTGTANKAAYEAALRSVNYQNFNDTDPSTITRTVTFSVTDGNSNGEGTGALTTTATRDILVNAVNDAPGVITSNTPLLVVEGDPATPVDPELSLSDVDDDNIAGASIQITGRYLASEDVLSFTDQGGITGSWNAATGTLTLTGTASKATYEAALRSVNYTNTNNAAPMAGARTITFSVTDSNSNGQGTGALTTTATRDVVVKVVNDNPEIATSPDVTRFTEGDAPVTIDDGIRMIDADDDFISGATVRISSHYLPGEDVLAFANQSGITGSWNAATGTLTLTGTASKALYQEALRTVTYQNTNDYNPSLTKRIVTFSITDSNTNQQGQGALTSSATREILLQGVNDAARWSGEPLPSPTGIAGDPLEFAFVPERYLPDLDSPAVRYTMGALPAWLQYDAAAKRFVGLPPAGESGVHAISFTATDNEGASATLVFNLTIALPPPRVAEAQSLSANTDTTVPEKDVEASQAALAVRTGRPDPIPTTDTQPSPTGIAPERSHIPDHPVDGTAR